MAAHRKDGFTLAATGDANITREALPYEGASDRFDRLLGLLRGADAAVANLEMPLHDYEPYPHTRGGRTYLRAPPGVVDELVGMGCDLFTAASNHALDYTHRGIESTIEALRSRGVPFAGLGADLYEARRPAYLETPAGRVAAVAATTSVAPGSEAGESSGTTRGRPGISPIHVEKVYELDAERVELLRGIAEDVGIEDRKREWRSKEGYGHDWDEGEFFHFMEMKFRETEPGQEGTDYRADDGDREAVLGWIREADRTADWVVASIHCHQGPNGSRNTETTPAFLRALARDAVDAGADAVVGHGPHVLRGVEVYDGAPILYSLGSFFYQFESIERLPPECYRWYGVDDFTKPSAVFEARSRDDEGNLTGHLAQERYWETAIPVCSFAGDGGLERIELYPCTLQREEPPSRRGVPVVATGDRAADILGNLRSLSAEFGTDLRVTGGTALWAR